MAGQRNYSTQLNCNSKGSPENNDSDILSHLLRSHVPFPSDTRSADEQCGFQGQAGTFHATLRIREYRHNICKRLHRFVLDRAHPASLRCVYRLHTVLLPPASRPPTRPSSAHCILVLRPFPDPWEVYLFRIRFALPHIVGAHIRNITALIFAEIFGARSWTLACGSIWNRYVEHLYCTRLSHRPLP